MSTSRFQVVPKVTVLPYMGKHREIVEADENMEVLYDPHGPMGLMIEETMSAEDSSDPLDILLSFERWLTKHHDMNLFEAVVRGVQSKSKV